MTNQPPDTSTEAVRSRIAYLRDHSSKGRDDPISADLIQSLCAERDQFKQAAERQYEENVSQIARQAALEAERDRQSARIAGLVDALEGMLDLYMQLPPGAFDNGVTDSTGTINEGEVRASRIVDTARAALIESQRR